MLLTNIKGKNKCMHRNMGQNSELLLGYMFALRRYTLSNQKCMFKLKQVRNFRAISVMVEVRNLVESTDGKQYLSLAYIIFCFTVSAKPMIKILPKYLGDFIKN